ncbi:MAG: GNAT family N-acetyltransferase [Bradyrhizobiaceae bacterium PARB1]|jgi:ribosomal protein S18 acetylase RimI-like enzyme|nr:MAG: GNAT family N-acetyltransferase [Bradyrhizobiaceae bacterium PARB1]
MIVAWRAMTAADLPAVKTLADIIHPAFPESAAVFANRLALHPAGCEILDGHGGPKGYVLSHPWHDCSPPPLDAVLEPVTSPSTYYIHDLALLPETRGSGAGAAIVGILAARARTLQLPNMTLVAVNNSVHFWQRQGFTVTHDPALEAKLASYGDQAHFMTRDLT